MAKIILNPALEAIQGHVGNMVFKRWEGQEIVAKMPDRTGIVPTANQLAQQDKFRLAALYGKSALADANTKQLYEDAADRKGIPVFALTLADFMNAPAVDEIDLAGYSGQANQPIHVRASDDVQVSGVAVAIRSQEGAVLEQGPAVKAAGSLTWTYTTTTALQAGQAVSIEVTATDLPGHTTTRIQARA